jgi:ADP-heptose:LPS heptosyltransferase
MRALDALRVGICWQGNPQHRGDHTRSVRLARFAELAAVPGVGLISLQKGPGQEQLAGAAGRLEVHDFGARTSDESMADAAALIAALDLVVCVDTAVGHLAGALGRPAWVLVSYNADWRWMRSRTDTAWYPSVRLFRQPKPGDWDSVFAEVRDQLTRLTISADPAVTVAGRP